MVGEFPCGGGSQVSMWWGVPYDLETPYVNRQTNRQPYMTENVTVPQTTYARSNNFSEITHDHGGFMGSNCNFLNVDNFQFRSVLNCILKLEKINSLN